jgi:uncharacterized protein
MLAIKQTALTIAIVCILSTMLRSQNASDFNFARDVVHIDAKVKSFTTFKNQLKNNDDQLDWVFTSMFFMYKEFFSSQDGQRCSFSPSCSLYSIEAIKNVGLIKGGIMTFDRLTRCNGLSPEKYTIDVKNRVLVDKIEW